MESKPYNIEGILHISNRPPMRWVRAGIACVILAMGSVDSSGGALQLPKASPRATGANAIVGPYLALGAGLLQQIYGEELAIVDVDSGRTKRIEGGWRVERFLSADDSRGNFISVCGTKDCVRVRTISYDGKVIATRDIPGLAAWTVQDLETFAVSPDGDAVAYNDRADKCIYRLELSTGDRKPVLENVRLILAEMYWVQPNCIILDIWRDLAPARTLTNSIVAIDLVERHVEVLCKDKSLDPRSADFALSPDRTSLAFTEGVREDALWAALQIRDLKSKEVRVVVPPEEGVFIKNVCWSTDGERLAYVRNARHEKPEPTADEMERVLSKLKKDEPISASEFKKLQASLDSLSTRYTIKMEVCIYSTADGHTTRINDFPDGMDLYGLAFLDESRLVMEREFPEEDKPRPALLTVDIGKGTTSTLAKGRFVGDVVPIAGGSKLICLTEGH